MRLSIASSALAAAFVLTPVATGHAPALGQDFSITNQAEPANPTRRDVMRQLQAWWDAHAYYPRHASNNNEEGTVKVHLVVLPDGRIWTSDLVASSGSHALDTAGEAVFREGYVRAFPTAGEGQADIDLSLHYVLAHRQDQPVAASSTPPVPKRPFTITNDPVKSPVLETMLQRVCTGTVVRGGIANHPIYGMHNWAQAVFFRKPDGTPWVNFYVKGYPTLSPVTETGKMVQWTVQENLPKGESQWIQYTAWSDGENHLSGSSGSRTINRFGVTYNNNVGGQVDLTCSTEVLPTVTWNDFLAVNVSASPFDLTPPDPP